MFSFASIHDSNMVLQKAPQRVERQGLRRTGRLRSLIKRLIKVNYFELIFQSILSNFFQVDQEMILEFNDVFYEVTTAFGT